MSTLEDFSRCVECYAEWERKGKINFSVKKYNDAFNGIQDTLGNDNNELQRVFPFYENGFSSKQVCCIVMGGVIYNNLISVDKRIDQDTVMENKESLSEMTGLRGILVKRYNELAEEANISFD